MKLQAAETGRMFAEEGIKSAAANYADAPMRQAHNKDPRGWSEFAHMLSEHSALDHSNTMFGVHLRRAAPTAALLAIPRTGHNITSGEPAAFNAALADLFFAAESGRWLAHKKAT
jgi:hypothetical protein